MTDKKWKDLGYSNIFESLTSFLGYRENVMNTETGEIRKVFVKPFQEVGDAISNGQFVDDEESDDEEEESDDD